MKRDAWEMSYIGSGHLSLVFRLHINRTPSYVSVQAFGY